MKTRIFHDGILYNLQLKSAENVSNGASDTESWQFEFDYVPRQRDEKIVVSFESVLQGLGIQYGPGVHAQEIKRQMLMVWNARGLADEQCVSDLIDGGEKLLTKIAIAKAILSSSS